MKHKPGKLEVLFLIALVLFTACTLSGCGTPSPSSPQPAQPARIQLTTPFTGAATALSPGLAVIYIDKFYRKISQMPNISKANAYGRQGRPLLGFNHQFGKDELVFDSGRPKGVGMLLTGYLHLAKPGEYRFKALANDGIEFVLDGKLVYEDPTVHKDRLSPVGIAEVSVGGWYPLAIRYFQRKGTATLKLYWQSPGTSGFSIIPDKMFAHKQKENTN